MSVVGILDLAAKIVVKRRLRGIDTIEVTFEERVLDEQGIVIEPQQLLFAPRIDNDAPLAFMVEQLERDEEGGKRHIVVTGRTLDGIALEARRAWPDPANYPADTAAHDEQTAVPAESAIKHYVDANGGPGAHANRQVPDFAVATDGAGGVAVTVAARYQRVLDIVTEIALFADLGWKVTYDAALNEHVFEVIEPVDRSASVIFGFEFDALKAWSEVIDYADSRTLAIVAGQGEEVDRDIVIRPAIEPTGLARRETFVDARDVPLGSTALLEQRGDAVLAASGPTTSLTATPREFGAFVYTQDWHLGDYVLAHNARRALSYAAQIIEVWLTVDKSASVPRVEAIIDRPVPSLRDHIEGRFSGGAVDQGSGGGGVLGDDLIYVGDAIGSFDLVRTGA